ncbi:uncharacterized protein LOC114244620 [Bombyx mandarina]|uniref:Uncharacterized protein LOC114244620 n=1 Tax=Bombyx mandarina TaxID=7092 RepID=A0A6J2JRX8_BOMMA|nr:uncharacterized protein LOC114244620 [Bombyx mandarina]
MRNVTLISTYLHPTLRNGFRQPEHMLSAKEMVRRELGNILKEFSTLALSSEQPEETTNNFKKPGILDFLHSRKLDIPNATTAAVNIVRMYIETEAARGNHTEIAGTFWISNTHLRSRRSRLLDDAVDQLCFLHQNFDLIQ